MQLFKKVLNFANERNLKTASDLFIYHNDFPGALAYVEKVLEAEPQNTRALVLYGDILFCINRDIEAMHALNQAILLDPELVEAYISKAGVLEGIGKFREALKCCRIALELIDSHKHYLLPSLFDQKIILLIRLKRFREAQMMLGRAASYLEEEDMDYLFCSYKSLLDQFCQDRRRVREKTLPPPLKVISGKPA